MRTCKGKDVKMAAAGEREKKNKQSCVADKRNEKRKVKETTTRKCSKRVSKSTRQETELPVQTEPDSANSPENKRVINLSAQNLHLCCPQTTFKPMLLPCMQEQQQVPCNETVTPNTPSRPVLAVAGSDIILMSAKEFERIPERFGVQLYNGKLPEADKEPCQPISVEGQLEKQDPMMPMLTSPANSNGFTALLQDGILRGNAGFEFPSSTDAPDAVLAGGFNNWNNVSSSSSSSSKYTVHDATGNHAPFGQSTAILKNPAPKFP